MRFHPISPTRLNPRTLIGLIFAAFVATAVSGCTILAGAAAGGAAGYVAGSAAADDD